MYQFWQCTSITSNYRFTILHRFYSYESERFPSRWHDYQVTSIIVTREFAMRYPAQEGDIIGVLLLYCLTTANYVIANDSQM